MEQLGINLKTQKKDYMSAFDLRDTEDLSPYRYSGGSPHTET